MSHFNFYRIYKGHPTMIFALEQGHSNTFYSGDSSGNLISWHVEQENGMQIAALHESILKIKSIPNENGLLYCSTLNGNLIKLDLNDKSSRSFKLLNGGIFDIYFEEDKLFFSGDRGIIGFCKTDYFNQINSICISNKRVRTFLNNANTMLAGTSEGRLVKISKNTLEIIKDTDTFHSRSILDICLYKEGFLSSGMDGSLIRWSGDLIPINQFQAHNTAIYRILPVAEIGIIFTACRDGSIRIWDMETLQLIRSIDKFYHEGHFRSVNDLLWLPENHLLLSCSDDREIRSWIFEN